MTKSEALVKAREAQASRAPVVHLFRGSPASRSWSKHQETTRSWSLCGMHWGPNAERSATEDEKLVTCEFCLQLLS